MRPEVFGLCASMRRGPAPKLSKVASKLSLKASAPVCTDPQARRGRWIYIRQQLGRRSFDATLSLGACRWLVPSCLPLPLLRRASRHGEDHREQECPRSHLPDTLVDYASTVQKAQGSRSADRRTPMVAERSAPSGRCALAASKGRNEVEKPSESGRRTPCGVCTAGVEWCPRILDQKGARTWRTGIPR